MVNRSFSFKAAARTVGAVVLVAGVVSGVTPVPASAKGGGDSVRVRMRDDCDPATFNEVVGPGTCVGGGDATFGEFVASMADGGHHGWRFQPSIKAVKPGSTLRIENRGGEPHSFTEVVNFGTIILPDPNATALLNSSLPPGTPLAVPINPEPAAVGATFVPAGGTLTLSVSSLGVHKFECMIHPWMRSTITVKK